MWTLTFYVFLFFLLCLAVLASIDECKRLPAKMDIAGNALVVLMVAVWLVPIGIKIYKLFQGLTL